MIQPRGQITTVLGQQNRPRATIVPKHGQPMIQPVITPVMTPAARGQQVLLGRGPAIAPARAVASRPLQGVAASRPLQGVAAACAVKAQQQQVNAQLFKAKATASNAVPERPGLINASMPQLRSQQPTLGVSNAKMQQQSRHWEATSACGLGSHRTYADELRTIEERSRMAGQLYDPNVEPEPANASERVVDKFLRTGFGDEIHSKRPKTGFDDEREAKRQKPEQSSAIDELLEAIKKKKEQLGEQIDALHVAGLPDRKK